MKRKGRSHYFIILVVALAFLAAPVRADDDPAEVKISATTIRPGDFFQVKVTAPEASGAQATFLGVTKSLQLSKGKLLGMLAASYYATPGNYPLFIEIIQGEKKILSQYQIQITERKFPEQRIEVPEPTRKEILAPEHQASDAQKSTEARKNAGQQMLEPLWDGQFVWPITGRKTADFGLIRYVNNIENGRHSGFDLAAPTGAPVSPVNQGIVIFAGTLYSTGLTVIIHHGMDLYTTYAHLSKILVKEGALVYKGDVIGKVGATGLATGAHLHLTIRVGEVAVDPVLFLGKEVGWEF